MKILHVYTSPSFSGAEAYAMDLARLQSEKHHIAFLAREGSPLAQRVASTGSLPLVDQAQCDFGKYDIVILHSTQELKTQWLRIARARLKGATTQFIVYTHIWISHSKNDPLHALLYRLVDSVWCSSLQSKKTLEKMLPIHRDRIRVIPYGREIDTLRRALLDREVARQKLGVPADATIIGTLGRVDKGKGSRELFEAMLKILKEQPETHFLMIGPPTSSDPKAIALNQEIDLEIERLPLELKNRITKKGHLENGAHYYKAFDLFVLATYKENFSLALLDAQIAEIPCLATDSGGSPDLVQTGRTGWLFKPESTESLYQTILRALTEKAQWPSMAKTARAAVESRHSFHSVLTTIDSELARLRPDKLQEPKR